MPKPWEVNWGEPEPSSPSNSMAQGAGKLLSGAAIGAAELVNPVSGPGSIERLLRGGYKYATTPKGLAQSFEEADKESFFPQGTLRQIAPIGRALVRKGFGGDQSIADIYDEEVAAQEAFQGDPLVQGSQTTTELLGAAGSIAQLALKGLPKMGQALTKLRGLKAMKDPASKVSLTTKELAEADRLQAQLLGDLGPELRKSLHENTAQVKALFEGPSEGRSVMSTVDNVRDSLSKNQELLGSTIREFRSAITSKNPKKFDTSILSEMLNDFKKSQTLSGGQSVMTPQEMRTLESFQTLLKNSGKKGSQYTFDTRDATVMIDKLDDYLNAQGYYKGDNITHFNRKASDLRKAMDADVAAMYPAYKEMKLHYSDFLNNYGQIQKKIEGLGAEGFVANMHGRNKSEVRQLFENTLNKGQETVDAFHRAALDADNVSSTNQAYNNVLASLRGKAKDIKFQSGKTVMQEIADKAMARRLADVSDKDADVIRDLVNKHIASEVGKADKKAEAIAEAGSTGLGTLAGWMRLKEGDLLGSAALGGATKYATKGLIKSGVKGLQGDVMGRAAQEAEQIYSVPNLLRAIEESKNISQETKDIGKATQFILNKFGEDSASAFFNNVKATRQVVKDLEPLLYGTAATQGLMKRSFANDVQQDSRKRNFANDILEFPPTIITPSNKFQERR